MTYVKICGVRTPEHAVAAAEAGADFIGMIMVRESRRHVPPEVAREIVAAVPRREAPLSFAGAGLAPPPDDVEGWFRHGARQVETLLAARRPLMVGVFVSAAAWIVNEFIAETGIDVAQASGDDPWHYCLEVQRPTLKAVHVLPTDTPESLMARLEPGMADMVLLDSRAGDRFGGTGQAFDWSVGAAVASRIPVVLAGGLTPDNVADAIRTVRPWAVDVSSGVETDGVKDVAKIRDFIAAVHATDAELAAVAR